MIDPNSNDIGRKVLYRTHPAGWQEEGVITRIDEKYVFVRYGNDSHSKATRPCDLEWSSP